MKAIYSTKELHKEILCVENYGEQLEGLQKRKVEEIKSKIIDKPCNFLLLPSMGEAERFLVVQDRTLICLINDLKEYGLEIYEKSNNLFIEYCMTKPLWYKMRLVNDVYAQKQMKKKGCKTIQDLFSTLENKKGYLSATVIKTYTYSCLQLFTDSAFSKGD